MILRFVFFLLVLAGVLFWLERSGSKIDTYELSTYESQFSEAENNVRKALIKQYQDIKNLIQK
jgi:hypothetical protein